ncbi:hypothetical protein [Pedobacter sp. SYSU D00535]|uniref:hypothetical protein n=1 Tax=Pedobacter sp. SYSU D00535 TaxID=2810308 RepID=UPI001A960B5A|nr:hypothetical protein [Pedobacter sp. SYSU D00535]
MTEPKLKADKDAGNLSESAKTHCMDIFISHQYGRQEDVNNKFIEKGLAVEEDAITLYSRVTKKFYKKNDQRLFNDYIQGEPDIFQGESIEKADVVKDIKSSWSIFTFLRTYGKKINPLYEWQGVGYSWLTGAKEASVAYCLVNTPLPLIEAEKRKLWYQLGQPSETDKNYQEACEALEKSLTYDDIPLQQRVLEYTIEIKEESIGQIIPKVTKAREYLVSLQEELLKTGRFQDLKLTA